MNCDDVIRMAREAGAIDMTINDWTTWVGTQTTGYLERFAALVTAHEREACAKLMEDKFDFCGDEFLAAEAIRARGEK